MTEVTKQCTKCGTVKSLDEFSKGNDKYGKYYWCNTCKQENRQQYKSRRKPSPAETKGTLQYFKRQSWWGILKRTINGKPRWTEKNTPYLIKGIRLEFTKEQFYQWCDQHRTEILALYDQKETPTIDRINSNGHYSLDNIRVLTHRQNSLLGATKGGCTPRPHKRRLSPEQIIEIRRRISKESNRSIAKDFGVSDNLISDIKNKRIYVD